MTSDTFPFALPWNHNAVIKLLGEHVSEQGPPFNIRGGKERGVKLTAMMQLLNY